MQESRPFVLYSSDSSFLLKASKTEHTPASYLKINRLTSKLSVLSEAAFEGQLKGAEKRVREELAVVLGVLVVNQQAYLCVGAQAEAVGTLQNEKVWCIRRVNFVPFKHKFLYLSVDQSENERILKELGENVMNGNLYFCYQLDLTLTYQKRLQRRSTERKYWWNEHMQMMFTHYQLPACWRIPAVQGHVKELYCENNYFSFYYCVVSRRSKFMGGTRFNSRGIDQNCNASNFVETEEIFVCHNYLFSHVSLRGSAPIFWSQEEFGAPIRFSRDDGENMVVLQKHYEFLKKEYQSNIVTVNLLSKGKSPEKELKNRLEFYLYKTLPNEPYLFYDLNEEIRDQENATRIIDDFVGLHADALAPPDNFLCVDRYTWKTLKLQASTARINCLDCIDRTNVIMSRVSLLFLQQVEQYINTHTNMEEKRIRLGKDYREAVVELWAELGDRISMIYCGTESVATHLTKQESNSFLSFLTGGFRSINRYYNASVSDPPKQQAIDYLLGNMQELSRTPYFDDNITRAVLEEPKYCSYEEIVLYVLTWNCNTVDPDKLTPKDKEKLFSFPVEQTDIVVICLQEMVELNSYNVLLGNNETIVSHWRRVIEKYLNELSADRKKAFVYLTSYDMVGVATFVFVSGQLYNRVYLQEWLAIKTGFKNSLGNKGAVLLFMQVDSTYLTLTNCHLAAGEGASTERLQDIQYIHNDALSDRQKRRLFEKSEYKLLVGDMNFRLQAKNEQVREILYSIEKQDAQRKLTKSDMQTYLQSLLQKDEYHLNNHNGALSLYSEATIYFLPTYKYVKKEKIYDTKRTPSWCDRVLFHAQTPSKLAVLKYWDVDCYQSDHKPVCAAFKLLLKKEDPDRKKKLLQIYMEQVE